MNTADLKSGLQHIYEEGNNVSVSVYAILKNREVDQVVKIDIENDAEEGLKGLFLDSINEQVIANNDVTITNLSTSDERTNSIYKYDLDDTPEDLQSLERVLESDDIPLMNLANTNLSSVKALVIEIGNNERQVVLYKTMAPVNIFGRSSFFMMKSNTRFKKVDEEFLRVSSNFQFFRFDEELFIVDIKALEKSFGFHELIKKEAALGVEAISEIDLLNNIDVLNELVDDIKYARKLTKIASASPVLGSNIENSSIINFCKNFPSLKGKIRFNESETKIQLDTKVSQELFIKVMMDDFLTSELTKFHYESIAKDTLEEIDESGD